MAGICTRSVTSVWLVGGTTDHFKTSKLPSRGEVLKVLFHYHINEKMSLKDSIEKTASMLLHIWEMARIITKAPAHGPSYNSKIWNHLKEVSLFVTAIYIKYWFESHVSTNAPRNDLALLCALTAYQNKEVAQAATTAFNRHLWYLSELLVGFAFFDDDVSVEEKRLMIVALNKNPGSEEPLKRITPFIEPTTKGLHDFVTTSTARFFKILGLSEDFLHRDPSQWQYEIEYKKNKDVAQSVKVVNDLAERGVALVQEFNSSLTRNEEQKQYLLQVVEHHRRQFAEPTKAAAIKLSTSANDIDSE